MYQAEIDKIKSEIKYKTLIDQIKDYAIFMLDVHGNISSWNKGAEQIFGYTSDEIIGNNYSVFFRGDDLTDKLPFLHLVQTTEKGNYENEGWRYRKNGSALWANVILTKLIDNSDNIESFFNITRDLTERKLVETQLVESEFELRKLTAQIQFAREAERQNIAREVHDQLGQIFTGINLNVSYLMDSLVSNKKFSIEDVLKELSTIKSYIDHGIEKVRDISGKLRSYILDHLGLIPALQEYCREIERISNLKCRFICTLDSIKLNNDKNITLFRIIQEALTNVIRHANATEVILEISQDENKLDVKISDDGKGIQQKSNKQYSMGILGMKERALFLNGVLKVESSEGAGTLIHLLIPL
jgi:PAS domain S-box-containing protein